MIVISSTELPSVDSSYLISDGPGIPDINYQRCSFRPNKLSNMIAGDFNNEDGVINGILSDVHKSLDQHKKHTGKV